MNCFLSKIKPVLVIVTVILSAGFCFSAMNPEINITHYEYGKIIVNDKNYLKDIVIWPDGTITDGPEDMHSLSLADFDELFNSGLKKVLFGTGNEGKAGWDFRSKLKKEIKNRGIELIIMDTHEAVKFLNNSKERDFLAYVHLNC
jgi:hypothetical protein